VVLDSGIELAPATINYGSFVQTIINFIIIALCVFMMIKGLAKLKNAKKAEEEKEEAPAAPAEPSNEEKLLTEIRDLLAKK
jgi:large conductance mechanosensitive channel